jgi:LysM repeat protein
MTSPGNSGPGLGQLSLCDGQRTVTFQYNPAVIKFSKSQVTKTTGTISQTLEQAVTDVHTLTFSIDDLRMEGKAALADIATLFDWLIVVPGPPEPPPPPAPGRKGRSAKAPAPPPSTPSDSPFTASIKAQRSAVLGTTSTESPVSASGWGKKGSGSEGKGGNQRGGPETLALKMGTGKGLTAGDGISSSVILKKVEVAYTRFNADGDPVRAKVNLTLELHEKPPEPQNPTSHSPEGGRVHVTSAGDSLPRIAQSTYADPSAWRDIASANGIDDPLRVRNGRSLFLPYARANGTR